MDTHYATAGCGSMIVEAAYAEAGLPLTIIDVPWEETGWDSPQLKALNPLGQVPTLVLADGTVMTESAAILLHVADVAPKAGLAPPPGDPLRPHFLRWLFMFGGPVYATFTYGDRPERWVGEGQAGQKLKATTNAHRAMLLRHAEAACGSPWFLGGRFSAIDLQLWPLTYWRPGKDWFDREAPKLAAVRDHVWERPWARGIAARNDFG